MQAVSANTVHQKCTEK